MPKILVVDDEPDLELLLRQRFRRKIRKGEVDLIFAENGVHALERLKEHPDVDMVLSDINMPQMDGLTLLAQLESLDRDLRAVIVTAYGDMKNIRTAMNRGAFDFITKPIDFSDLEATISKTLNHLDVMRDALQARDDLVALRQELGVASAMQESILPTNFPTDPRYELYAWMTPAKEVGGDFYDFFPVENGLGLVIADVSGKGVPAAFFMLVARTLLKGTAVGMNDPVKIMKEVNRLVEKENEQSMFVTVFFTDFNPDTGELRFANAGHNLPVILRANGELEQIDCEAGIVLGIMDPWDFPGGSVTLNPGDAILLYTDGVTEAMDEEENEFGDAELLEVMGECVGMSATQLTRHVVKAVQEHAGSAEQSDDITCLAVRYLGPGT